MSVSRRSNAKCLCVCVCVLIIEQIYKLLRLPSCVAVGLVAYTATVDAETNVWQMRMKMLNNERRGMMLPCASCRLRNVHNSTIRWLTNVRLIVVYRKLIQVNNDRQQLLKEVSERLVTD